MQMTSNTTATATHEPNHDLASFKGWRSLPLVGPFQTPGFVRRYSGNPVLSAEHVPYPAALVFNCSVWKEHGRYRMLFRNDYADADHPRRLTGTNFGMAESADGENWTVLPEPVFSYQTTDRYQIGRVYDPRVIPLEGRYYLTCCAESRYGVQATTFVTDDFKNYELIDRDQPNSRNTLLFPEKIGGKYYRLERPFTSDFIGALADHTGLWLGEVAHTWISSSPDLIHWGQHEILVDVAQTPYANCKNGPGAVPIRTDRGWLLLIHGVDFDPARGRNGWQDAWKFRYHAGVALVDLEDPTRLLGVGRIPLITPEAPYETEGGFRNDVIFPMSGIIEDNGDLRIYYGAADTHICMATAPLEQVLDMCEPV